jgi:hypothetical protein
MYILTIFREERVGCWLLDLLRENMPKAEEGGFSRKRKEC